MKYKLECGSTVRVTKHSGHPLGMKGKYVLDINIGDGISVLRLSGKDKNVLTIVPGTYVNIRDLAAINEIMNADVRLFHNFYMNTKPVN